MDIYAIRKEMTVTNYRTDKDGATITYFRKGKHNFITIPRANLINALMAIGSLDNDNTPDEIERYCISQWDALNIAIRYESTIEMDLEIENTDIFKAISDIIKPK